MKKKYIFFIILIILIVLIMFSILSLIINKNESLVSMNSDEVVSIAITEWQGQTIIIKDKNAIDKFVNDLEALKMNKSFWYIGTPDNWNLRISIYGSFDISSSIIKESFYLGKDGKVYMNNYVYILDDFDYNYFLGLFKE